MRRLPQAIRDVDEIWLRIAQDDPDAADRLVEKIAARTAILAHYPNAGRARPELGPDIRSLVEGYILILYRVDAKTVDIVRVVHGARDLASLLIAGITPDTLHGEAGLERGRDEETR